MSLFSDEVHVRQYVMSLFAGESLTTISDVISFKWNVLQQQTILLFSDEAFDNDKPYHCFQVRCLTTTNDVIVF